MCYYNFVFLTSILVILGLALFETVSSVDNAVINAQVLTTMSGKGRRWFLLWGLLVAVFLMRGLLPLLIVWATNPSLGIWGALTATFNSDPGVITSIHQSAHILLIGGGTFLLFLFFHWLFLEKKEYGLKGEQFFFNQGIWFYAVVSIVLAFIVLLSLKTNSLMAFGAVIGSAAFFVTHGFREQVEKNEQKILSREKSDMSKILYLEIIDATFSIDGVLGAFAFTLSVPLILLGSGIGAMVVRKFTVGNIERIKKYKFLENGAMYSVFILGLIMILDSFKVEVPEWVSPIVTFLIVGYFFLKSRRALNFGRIQQWI